MTFDEIKAAVMNLDDQEQIARGAGVAAGHLAENRL